MKQYVKITLKEYKALLDILGEYKLLCYAYRSQPDEEVPEKRIIGFKGDEEDESKHTKVMEK